MGINDEAKDVVPDNAGESAGEAGQGGGGMKDKAGDVAGTIKDKAGDVAGTIKVKAGDVAGTIKQKAQGVAQNLDHKAEELSQKDGVVGKVAGAAHTVLEKVGGDDVKADATADPSLAVRETKDGTGSSI